MFVWSILLELVALTAKGPLIVNSVILMNMTDSVISADDHWVLWTALVVAAALNWKPETAR